MKVEKVKVGIVGLGMVCYSHIDAYEAHPDSEVVAVCDLNEAQAKAVAEKYGISKYYTDYAEMLKDPEVNTVDITKMCIRDSCYTYLKENGGRISGHRSCSSSFCPWPVYHA